MANTPDPLKSHDQLAEVPIFIFHRKKIGNAGSK